MKNKYILLVLFVMVVQAALAQKTLTGTVTEMFGNSKEPCIGVNVTFVNSQNRILAGTVTDFNGNYTLKVPAEKGQITLKFSYIGMQTQSFKYNGETQKNVTMKADSHQIKEVEVKGSRSRRNEMGLTQKQQSFATQKIDMSEITAVQPVTSIEEALQGQLGGVDIIAAGDPGAKSSIRIRGTATLNSNADPLIVVNGVPYSTDIDDSFDFNTANQEDFAQMLSLNPNDIESIEVLKDAASTAVYGTAGANGVLLITTKKGAMGKTRFTFSTKNSLKVEPESMPMLNGDQYKAFIQDAIWNTANARGLQSSGDLLEFLFDTPEINYNESWRYFDEYNQNVDWLSYLTKNAFTTDNSFSMSGGGERATYRFSLSYLSEGGTTEGTGLTRFNTSIDIGYRFSDKLMVNTEYTYSDTEKKSPWTEKLRAEAIRKMPNKSPYYIDDATGAMTDTYFTRQNSEEFQGAFSSNDNGGNSTNFHPLIMADESYRNLNTKEQKMTVRANWYILPELTFRGYVSMKYKTSKTEAFLPQAATGVMATSTFANRSDDNYSNNFSLQSEAKLTYAKEWQDKKHQFTATGLWRTSQSTSSTTASARYNVASAEIADPGSGGGVLLSVGSGKSEVRSLSGIGSVVYTFLDRYTINGTVNYEGKSSLGKNNRWGLFPSLGASWILSDEPFMKWASSELTQAKIRASYGMSGNAPSGTSPYVGTYTAVGNYMDGSAVSISTMQLNKLKWESSREIDLGFDLNFWDGKLTATFDWYRKDTKDLLQKNVTLPSSIGLPTPRIGWYNSGKIRNEGWEFRIDYEVLKTKDWQFKVNYNVNRNKNTIVELPQNINEEQFSLSNGKYAQRLISGTAVGSFFGFKYLGVYQNTTDTYAKDAQGGIMYDMQGKPIVMKNGQYTCYPGDAKYADINNDGKIDKNDIVYIGNSNPILSGGGGFNLKYKSLSLTVFLHYRLGQKIVNSARMNAESMYGSDNQSTAVLRRWRNEGDQTEIPRALWKYGLNYLGSDRFVEDCSFVRLKTLSLSYTLPKKFVQNLGLTSANVFLTGYDLFTFTDYTGQDPEVTLPSGITSLAEDRSQTPRSKRFSMGVTINF
ncbi:SusC/RagA family TonB-linked outer membrane protein [Xylanibacter muris]|uniref:SusC/RagA family TonB-linked outer membrane protein n=1 Tax=Xylanibacter muris TaxID=2736290 RepID=A0ABX2AKA1_9BACT|nr:SusC/RagA family TonB-linked outer membrane protein [Xylanibacter muris]NPD90962.1 SusC/RagA family TonB-linked outer membrane protein [Xylanibacter muris]